MTGTYSHYRVNAAFEEGTGSAEMIIKLCMVAFPSINVGCDTCVLDDLLCYVLMALAFLWVPDLSLYLCYPGRE